LHGDIFLQSLPLNQTGPVASIYIFDLEMREKSRNTRSGQWIVGGGRWAVRSRKRFLFILHPSSFILHLSSFSASFHPM
jgi:hypothetical protein